MSSKRNLIIFIWIVLAVDLVFVGYYFYAISLENKNYLLLILEYFYLTYQ
ncbi:hypothetical protein [Marinitoga litoralis]|nr:hypothetical protein [Marinitoga litoralis]MBM7559904.1 hypothetical protein [Marinitoga litoralis]